LKSEQISKSKQILKSKEKKGKKDKKRKQDTFALRIMGLAHSPKFEANIVY
jgi:hypothetical protein